MYVGNAAGMMPFADSGERMQPRFVDLHTHTTASDGTDTPAELVGRAARLGLAAVAVTDHDTLSGLDEAERAGREQGLEVIRGCELGVVTPYGEMHLLGLWLPARADPLEERLADLRARRADRNRQIVARLNRLGLALTYGDVLRHADGESVGRPHIAAALLEHGYVTSRQEAFARFLGAGGAAYVPRALPTPEEGVTLMAGLGATVCVAHPMLLRCPASWWDEILPRLKACGLDGLEAYHSEHSDEDERFCVELARRYDLGLSGGSDYHGLVKPRVRLGRGHGDLRVTLNILEGLKRRRLAAGLPLA